MQRSEQKQQEHQKRRRTIPSALIPRSLVTRHGQATDMSNPDIRSTENNTKNIFHREILRRNIFVSLKNKMIINTLHADEERKKGFLNIAVCEMASGRIKIRNSTTLVP